MGHHYNQNPSTDMRVRTLNTFRKRLGGGLGKNKDERVEKLLKKFNNHYLHHTPKHIEIMIFELKNNKNMTFEEAHKIAMEKVGI